MRTMYNNFSESEFQKLSTELRDVRVQLNYEVIKRKRVEKALKQQQNSSKVLIVYFIFLAFCKWAVSYKDENLPERDSIFPIDVKLNSAFQFIEDNYHQPINLSDVAQAVGYSRSYLTSLTKSRTKRAIHSWIMERRMAEARYLLLKTNESVTQIAIKVGYSDPSYFSRQFRKLHESSPKVWRDENRKG